MTYPKKISLLTLVGLILPFGNIWGPYLIKVPKDSSDNRFRSRLVIFETILTLVALISSIVLMVKAVGSSYDTNTMSKAAVILFIQNVIIFIVALYLAFFTKPK